jgi:hypothetical protein
MPRHIFPIHHSFRFGGSIRLGAGARLASYPAPSGHRCDRPATGSLKPTTMKAIAKIADGGRTRGTGAPAVGNQQFKLERGIFLKAAALRPEADPDKVIAARKWEFPRLESVH